VAKRKPIIVNGHPFKTKKALREYIRKIRDSYIDRQHLNEADFEFMLDLLNRHERPEIKIGCGVKYIYVKTNEVFKHNREFWLVRIDGSETDFSFEICLKHKTKLQKFKNACRTSVADIVMDFKKDFFDSIGEPSVCPLTGGEMAFRKNSHVDHAPPETFDKIVQDFISLNGLDVNEIELLTAEDGRIRNEMVDKTLEQQFIKFHNERAKLRVISKLANLSLVKRDTNK
jgi:hypothetical protein